MVTDTKRTNEISSGGLKAENGGKAGMSRVNKVY